MRCSDRRGARRSLALAVDGSGQARRDRPLMPALNAWRACLRRDGGRACVTDACGCDGPMLVPGRRAGRRRMPRTAARAWPRRAALLAGSSENAGRHGAGIVEVEGLHGIELNGACAVVRSVAAPAWGAEGMIEASRGRAFCTRHCARSLRLNPHPGRQQRLSEPSRRVAKNGSQG